MIAIDKKDIDRLNDRAEQHSNNSVLFRFRFRSLNARGIYFAKCSLLLIGLSDYNLGWTIVLTDGKISEHIPKEVYTIIRGELVKDGVSTNRPFFEALLSAISNLSLELHPITNESILLALGETRTNDRLYDKEGGRPFFNHWRRVKPTKMSLNKIQRCFGWEIRRECLKRQLTAVWSTSPSPASLSFLDPQNVFQNLDQKLSISHE